MSAESPDLHDVIEISYSRTKLVVVTLLLVGFAGWLGFWAAALINSGYVVAAMIGWGSALLLLGLLAVSLPPLVRVWLHEGPVVTMDVHGIVDARQPDAVIEWQDVSGIELGIGSASYRLCFTLRDDTREPGPLRAVRTVFRFLAGRGDFSVDLRLLAGGRLQIWQAAKQMRQLGIRQHVLRSREALERDEAPAVAGEHRLEY